MQKHKNKLLYNEVVIYINYVKAFFFNIGNKTALMGIKKIAIYTVKLVLINY